MFISIVGLLLQTGICMSPASSAWLLRQGLEEASESSLIDLGIDDRSPGTLSMRDCVGLNIRTHVTLKMRPGVMLSFRVWRRRGDRYRGRVDADW